MFVTLRSLCMNRKFFCFGNIILLELRLTISSSENFSHRRRDYSSYGQTRNFSERAAKISSTGKVLFPWPDNNRKRIPEYLRYPIPKNSAGTASGLERLAFPDRPFQSVDRHKAALWTDRSSFLSTDFSKFSISNRRISFPKYNKIFRYFGKISDKPNTFISKKAGNSRVFALKTPIFGFKKPFFAP